ncbi:aspartyl-phosphate phosphatase Spo0E family protein [Sporolactobacillus sp. Y61]|jgi:hypothetical protein|uniref:Aspartyl-phosphate phosphatase Spo0E family protein n=1 Tax=Sporolactobacillus sp. Y61 TaxID=3160863 RepID=A0AAU8IBS8_9BACL|nr:aspartyl-phosphate phosphatase Spo0E family protein [Sporolactobacillus sp. THM19-2]RYL92826.1 aspartyl-phosphate phosphatase Spo0E family protein [Sporolactobacillus sp. THM19-2]
MSDFPAANKSLTQRQVYPENIENKRNQLFHIAKIYGIYASETIRCSQELDLLIIKAQKELLQAN